MSVRLTGICLPDSFVWQRRYGTARVATRCGGCSGTGFAELRKDHGTKKSKCGKCNGGGWHGIDPAEPTDCTPAQEVGGELVQARVAVWEVRYAAGLPIWNPDDVDIRPKVLPNPDRTYPREHKNHWDNME